MTKSVDEIINMWRLTRTEIMSLAVPAAITFAAGFTYGFLRYGGSITGGLICGTVASVASTVGAYRQMTEIKSVGLSSEHPENRARIKEAGLATGMAMLVGFETLTAIGAPNVISAGAVTIALASPIVPGINKLVRRINNSRLAHWFNRFPPPQF